MRNKPIVYLSINPDKKAFLHGLVQIEGTESIYAIVEDCDTKEARVWPVDQGLMGFSEFLED